MDYYGNEPLKPGTRDNVKPVEHREAIKPYVPRGKAVQRVREDGTVIQYPSVTHAAKAMGVKPPTMSAWCRDGLTRLGSVWGFGK